MTFSRRKQILIACSLKSPHAWSIPISQHFDINLQAISICKYNVQCTMSFSNAQNHYGIK